MYTSEAENVCVFLKSKEIHLSSNNSWLNSCIDWYKSHLELGTVYGSLQEFVCIQWLLADLRDVCCSCLPVDCSGTNVLQLTAKYSVQINWVRDIAQSCYSQFQHYQNNNVCDSNDSVTADEPKKQGWEPNPKRVLLMEITDGTTTLQAVEYSPISKITDTFLPGLKVTLIGPIECRKGILFLQNNNVHLCGGEVECLYPINAKENLLTRCLDLPSNNNMTPPATRDTNTVITNQFNVPHPAEDNRYQMTSEVDEVPHSTPRIDHLAINGNEDMLLDEDDDYLCHLPDEVLNYSNDIEHNSNISPILDGTQFVQNRPVESNFQSNENRVFTEVSGSTSKPLSTNKPSLFPSLEDLRPCGEKATPLEPEGLSALPKDLPPKVQMSSLTSRILENPPVVESSILPKMKLKNSNVEQNHFSMISCSVDDFNLDNRSENCKSSEFNLSKNRSDLEDSYEKTIIKKEKYIKVKKLDVKVKAITKLKIRNGDWYCCASVVIENESLNVTFSNEVLEKLFGISASEVEIWRGEMASNLSLKKKVNDILKAGQTKLKLLKCAMTLQYSSEDGVPEVVEIHVHVP